MNSRRSCILAGISGISGVVLLALSFAINNGPPAGASDAELLSFAQHNSTSVLWGAWLQAIGPALIILFAFSLVHLAGAVHRLAGWMTFFGATSLCVTESYSRTHRVHVIFCTWPRRFSSRWMRRGGTLSGGGLAPLRISSLISTDVRVDRLKPVPLSRGP